MAHEEKTEVTHNQDFETRMGEMTHEVQMTGLSHNQDSETRMVEMAHEEENTVSRRRDGSFRNIAGFKKEKNEKKEMILPSLVNMALGWTLTRILDDMVFDDKRKADGIIFSDVPKVHDLYELRKKFHKEVEKIPETFLSVQHYLSSYRYPLIEETRANMLSSMSLLYQAPICEVISIEESDHYKPPNSLCYDIRIGTNIDVKKKRAIYQPQMWDVIALSEVKPGCIDDLNKPPTCYLPAIVVGIDEDNPNLLEIYALKPICVQEFQEENREPLFATFLINMTTNIRIWKPLNGENKNTSIIKEVLDANSKAGDRCDICSVETDDTCKDLNVDLNSMNLNDSQLNAVINAIETSKCSHKSSFRLIWGPPGTGKTKTVASMLLVLLKMKCRTLTCAPTNIATIQVASRLLKLAKESLQEDLYGLGDIVLLGNEKRMKLNDLDELCVIFIKYRVERLAECFVPLTGWRHQLDSMISLLEEPQYRYHLYLENRKKKNEKVGSDKHDTCEKEDQTREDLLTFSGYIRKQFGLILKPLKYCIRNLCTHMPTSCMSESIASKMNTVLHLLKSLRVFLHDTTTNAELDAFFDYSEDLDYTSGFPSESSLFGVARDCLHVLKSIRAEFSLPNYFEKSLIKGFCLENARLIFCTASSSASLHQVRPFEMVVIDEAAQLKECESAIPIQLPCVRRAVFIGDERQLPAMVMSKIAEKAGFGRSLFERLVSLGHRKHLLNIQYRMHPSISLFPNTEFYDKQISDAPNVKDDNYKKLLLQGNMYGSYSFIDVSYGKEEFSDGHSRRNMAEVAVVSEIVAKLHQASLESGRMISIGVISPYKAQVFALQEKLGVRYGGDSNFLLSVRSVDGFQGGEEDVIIISTVRSNGNGSVGFLSNRQRTNVALTRARYCLWIIGNGTTLMNSDSVWKRLLVDAQKRQCYFSSDNDQTLAKVLMESLVKLEELEYLLEADSILFRSARWKVMFSDDFRKSLARMKNIDTRKELVSLLVKLSNGWRHSSQGQRIPGLTDGTSSQLMETYKVQSLFHLVWTVDIVKEGLKLIQVLKFWDFLPLSDVPRLAKRLDIIFGSFTVDKMDRCKFKCLEGKLEIPMSWEISPDEVAYMGMYNNEHERLSTQFASLRLNDGHSRSGRFPSFRGRGRKSSKRFGGV